MGSAWQSHAAPDAYPVPLAYAAAARSQPARKIPFGRMAAYLYGPLVDFYVRHPPVMNTGSRWVAVTLRKSLESRIRQGHPWVFRDALADPPRLVDGTPVLVRARNRRPLAVGFWDATSPIAVRLLAVDPPASLSLADLVAQRLEQALAVRRARLDSARTNAFRWVHGEADRLPGLHLDLYADVAAVRFDGAGARAFYRRLPDLLATIARPLQLRTAIDRETRQPLPGAGEGNLADQHVLENGLQFGVDLEHGQKGGLFLDQRDNRAEVGRRSADRTVLNLFGYTGGFSVYAAAGGARRTDTVDLARPAIEAARANFQRNRLDTNAAGFHATDAFAFLTAAAKRGDRWDIVISDPPSFAPRASALPAARKAYRRLHQLAVSVTAEGGLFCPASCSSHFPRPEFLDSVRDGLAAAGRRLQLESLCGAGFDHPTVPWFPEGDYLKFALCRV
jgi:23S rRNA (cytosine1962-C5)-methyltransferase